ncbi:unnamed protein product [Lepidochelys kempii]
MNEGVTLKLTAFNKQEVGVPKASGDVRGLTHANTPPNTGFSLTKDNCEWGAVEGERTGVLKGHLFVRLSHCKGSEVTLQLLFLDGEEAFREWSERDSLYGAVHGQGSAPAGHQPAPGYEPVCLAGPAGGPPPDHPEPLPLHRLLVRPARRHREVSAPAGPAAVPPLGADVLPEGACLWACRRGPRPLPSQRSAGAAPHRHPFPVGLAHDGGHGAESAPPDCGEPLQDPGCLPGQVPVAVATQSLPWRGNQPLSGPHRILRPSWAELHGASSQNTLGTRQGGLGGPGCGSRAGSWGGVTMLGGWEGRLC